MSPQQPQTSCEEKTHSQIEEPGRTPDRAEGGENKNQDSTAEKEQISGPAAVDQERPEREEPQRTPGKAEG